MVMGPRLDLRQSQTLQMTPQLRQAIKLLQFSNQEVSAFIEQELERNPLLERAVGDEAPPPEQAAPARLARVRQFDSIGDRRARPFVDQLHPQNTPGTRCQATLVQYAR